MSYASTALQKQNTRLLPGCRGALGCWSGVCRTPHSRSPAVACRGTSHSRWPSGTACRGSRKERSSLEGRGKSGVKSHFIKMWHQVMCWQGVYTLTDLSQATITSALAQVRAAEVYLNYLVFVHTSPRDLRMLWLTDCWKSLKTLV